MIQRKQKTYTKLTVKFMKGLSYYLYSYVVEYLKFREYTYGWLTIGLFVRVMSTIPVENNKDSLLL